MVVGLNILESTFRENVTVLSLLTVRKDNITTTSTDGLVLENATAATDGVRNQWGPRLRLRGHARRYGAGEQDESHDWIFENEPSAASAADTTSILYFKTSRAGAAYTAPMYISNFGNITILGTYTGETVRSAATDATLTVQNRAFSAADSAIEAVTGAWTHSSGTGIALALIPTHNQSGTASAIDLLVSRKETAVGSGAQFLANLGTCTTAGDYTTHTSRFTVDNTGKTAINLFSLATTTTPGLLLNNGSVALVGTQIQVGPALQITGRAWTGATSSASHWYMDSLPTAASPITSTLRFRHAIDSGAIGDVATLSSGGIFALTGFYLGAGSIATDTTTGIKIATAANQKIGFFNATPVIQPTALTGAIIPTSITTTATPDYNWTYGAHGFGSEDEAKSVQMVINNLCTRVGEICSKLQALGLIA